MHWLISAVEAIGRYWYEDGKLFKKKIPSPISMTVRNFLNEKYTLPTGSMPWEPAPGAF
jgi:hypothetical protein